MTPKIPAAKAFEHDAWLRWLDYVGTPPRQRIRRRRLLREAEGLTLRFMQQLADAMAEAGWSPGDPDGDEV